MKNKYIIQADKRLYTSEEGIGLTYITVFLDKNLKWIEAGSDALEFDSPKNAANFFKGKNIHGPQLGTDGLPKIYGPRGGCYSIFTGKIYK